MGGNDPDNWIMIFLAGTCLKIYVFEVKDQGKNNNNNLSFSRSSPSRVGFGRRTTNSAIIRHHHHHRRRRRRRRVNQGGGRF